MDIALDLGADFVATGHYCRKGEIKKNGNRIFQLLAGKDKNKDQSYFLCQLSQEQLAKSLFPIGELTKPEVRKIALELDLITAEKRDSQGLCFIGKVKLPDFLQAQLKPKDGNIIQISPDAEVLHTTKSEFSNKESKLAFLAQKNSYKITDGQIVGKHQGAHFFTIGQRKGLAVGGTKEPLYVISTDIKDNIIYVGEGKNHPGLYRKALYITESDIHWIRKDLELKIGESLEIMARIRYRQPLQNATIYRVKNGLFIEFNQLQSAITQGQFAAWYIKEELIGSGVID
jgi:tRNA-specific 2-thiouridylase